MPSALLALLACTGPEVGDPAASTVSTAPGVMPEACTALTGDAPEVRYVLSGVPVGGDGSAGVPFASPAEAIAAAEPGWEIRVASGEYLGGVVLADPVRHRSVWMRGCGETRPRVDGGFAITGYSAAALDGVHVSGIDILRGIFGSVSRATDVDIEEVTLWDAAAYGLHVSGSTVSIADVVVENSGGTAIVLDSSVVTATGAIVSRDAGDVGLWVRSGAALDASAADVTIERPLASGLYVQDATAHVGSLSVSGMTGAYQCIAVGGGALRLGDARVEGCGNRGISLAESATLEVEGTVLVSGTAATGAYVTGGSRLGVQPEGSLTIDGTGQSGIIVGDRGELASAGRVRISDAGISGISAIDGTIAASDLEVSGVATNCLSVNASSAVVGTTSLSGCGGLGVIVSSGATLTSSGDMRIEGSGNRGVEIAGASTGTWEAGLVVLDSTTYALYVNGSTADVAVIQVSGNLSGSCLYFYDADVNLGSASLTACRVSGIDVIAGSVVAITGDIEVDGPVAAGLALDSSVVTLGDAAGLVVQSAGTYGVYAKNAATLDIHGRVEVVAPTSEGFAVTSAATVSLAVEGYLAVSGSAWSNIYVGGATARLEGTVESSDSARCGLLAKEGADVSLSNATISGNRLTGVYVNASSLALSSSTITGTVGSSSNSGDGLALVSPGTVSVTDVEFLDNARAAILVSDGAGTVTGGRASGNALSIVQQDCATWGTLALTDFDAAGNADDAAHLCDGTTLVLP